MKIVQGKGDLRKVKLRLWLVHFLVQVLHHVEKLSSWTEFKDKNVEVDSLEGSVKFDEKRGFELYEDFSFFLHLFFDYFLIVFAFRVLVHELACVELAIYKTLDKVDHWEGAIAYALDELEVMKVEMCRAVVHPIDGLQEQGSHIKLV